MEVTPIRPRQLGASLARILFARYRVGLGDIHLKQS